MPGAEFFVQVLAHDAQTNRDIVGGFNPEDPLLLGNHKTVVPTKNTEELLDFYREHLETAYANLGHPLGQWIYHIEYANSQPETVPYVITLAKMVVTANRNKVGGSALVSTALMWIGVAIAAISLLADDGKPEIWAVVGVALAVGGFALRRRMRVFRHLDQYRTEQNKHGNIPNSTAEEFLRR